MGNNPLWVMWLQVQPMPLHHRTSLTDSGRPEWFCSKKGKRMNQVARVFVVINLLLGAAFLAAAATFLKQSDDWKAKYNEAEVAHAGVVDGKDAEIRAQRADIQRRSDDLSKKVDEKKTLESDKRTLQDQLNKAVEIAAERLKVSDSLQTTHNAATTRLDEISGHLGTLDGLVDKYKEQAANAIAAEHGAIKDKVAAVAERESVRETVRQRDNTIKDLQGQLAERTAVLTTYTNVYPPPGATERKKINGQVLQYRATSNVVQINAGKEQGVVVGHEFDILRGSQFICTVKVDSVEDKTCVGHMTKVRAGSRTPRGGDQATTL